MDDSSKVCARGNQWSLISLVDALPLCRLRSDSHTLILCKTAGKTFPLSGVFLHGCATLATLTKGPDNFIRPIGIRLQTNHAFRALMFPYFCCRFHLILMFLHVGWSDCQKSPLSPILERFAGHWMILALL